MIQYSSCPVCKSEAIKEQLTAIDYTVSKEIFSIWHCDDCELRFTQNVPGENEIGPYYKSQNYISHSDTKKGFIHFLYHRVRKITLENKRRLVMQQTNKTVGEILDIGCGTGAFLHTMETAHWAVSGIEPDETARKNAVRLYGIQPQQPDALFALSDSSYNAVTMWHVLEHVHELHEYISKIEKLLTKGGKLFVAVPNYTSPDAGFYGKHWAAYDVPRHLYHFSTISMHTLMAQHGLVVTRMKPMWFDSFYVCMLSEKYKNGFGNLVRAFFSALLSNLKALSNVEKCSSVIYVISKA